MLRYIKEYRFYIILFLFILIPIVAIDTSTRAQRDFKAYDRVILAITFPVQKVLAFTLDTMSDVIQNTAFLFRARQENQRLIEQNRLLLQSMADLREMQQENVRLKRLLGFQEKFKLKTIVAAVVARDVNPDFRMIRISRGESSGVQKDMAVVSYDGVVGRVLRTTKDYADVVTLLDPLSAIDAINERTRAPGVISGKSEDALQLKYTLRTDDIQANDVLVSSGIVGVFPKGVPIGSVTRAEKKTYGITQDVEVAPAVQFKKLEEVLVVVKQDNLTADVKLDEKAEAGAKTE